MDTTQKLKQAIDFAKKNPEDPMSIQLRRRIESGMYNNELSQIKAESIKPKEQNALTGIVKGGLQTLGSTAKGLANIGEGIKENTIGRITGTRDQMQQSYQQDLQKTGLTEDNLTPNTTAEKIGNYGTQIATLFAPVSKIQKGVEAAAAVKGVNKLGSKLLGNAAEGAAFNAGASIEEGKTPTVKNTVMGAAVNTGVGLAGQGVDFLVNHLPARLVQGVIKGGMTKEEANQALSKIKFGGVNKLKAESQDAILNYENQIQSHLDSKYLSAGKGFTSDINVKGHGDKVFDTTLAKFPDSDYTREDIISTIKDLVPEKSKLVTKIVDGEATLAEKNILRKAVDQSVKSVYTSMNRPPAKKAIGAAFADSLRNEVKTFAPETIPVFDDYAKEINLYKALAKAGKRIDAREAIGLNEIAGYAAAGPAGVLTEKVARLPAVQLGAAKILKSAGNLLESTSPLIKKAATGVKRKIVQSATS